MSGPIAGAMQTQVLAPDAVTRLGGQATEVRMVVWAAGFCDVLWLGSWFRITVSRAHAKVSGYNTVKRQLQDPCARNRHGSSAQPITRPTHAYYKTHPETERELRLHQRLLGRRS